MSKNSGNACFISGKQGAELKGICFDTPAPALVSP